MMAEAALKQQKTYTLLIELGRAPKDGLPKEATGGALMCFTAALNEAEAVRETIALLKTADMNPLNVTSYGTKEERLAEGHALSEEELKLMDRALNENSVIIYQTTPFFEES